MSSVDITRARILIVDDQEANVLLLARILERAGYTAITSLTESQRVPAAIETLDPDLILLDLHMPPPDGFTLLEGLRQGVSSQLYLPVLVLTADGTSETKERALRAGASDFLTKPFEPVEVTLRIRNLLETRRLHIQLREENLRLEDRVRERTRELEAAQVEILDRLARAVEYRDDATGRHGAHVGELSALLAGELGQSDREVRLLRQAIPLHDVGKIAIPDAILLKQGRLTPTEYAVMQTHTTIGHAILVGSSHRLLQLAAEIALTHHERWDGTGYPHQVAGEAIPLAGRIAAVIDVFDALTHERPYKRAWSIEESVAEIARQAGQHFDPRVVEAFLALHRRGVFAAVGP